MQRPPYPPPYLPLPPMPSQPLLPHKRVWQWYRRASKGVQLGVGCHVVILLLCTCASFGTAVAATRPTGSTASVVITPTPTPVMVTQNTVVPTRASIPTLTPTPMPTPTPTPCPGVNCNPWGYNVVPGSLITAPPSAFCSYFACIPDFVNEHGYVVESRASEYSKSGGIQGACSYHGGV